MLRHRNKGRGAALVCLLALALCLLAGCGGTARAAITSLEELGEPGTRIGVPGDIKEYDTLQRDYPEAEVLVYDNYPNAYEDVANGRLDAYIYSRLQMELAMESGTSGVRLLEENYSVNTVAVGLSPVSPIPALPERFNAFLSELRADGTLDDMYLRWVIRTEDTMPEIALPEHPTYRLRVGTTGTVLPYSYYAGTELRGHDIELAYRFAAWLGADLEFKIYDFGGIIAAASVGDVDCVMSNLFVTEENSQTIPFSDPLFDVEITAMVRADGSGQSAQNGDAGFFQRMADSFEKTFLRENRWKLFLKGVGTTLLITVLSIVLGTALGFGVFLLCRKGNPVANAVTRFCVWLVQGMPMVVLLMILYYLIFGRVNISGALVSVIGFTLVFGAALFGMLKSGVGAVDKGQLEAAYALGYTDSRAFFRVVLPQALPHFFPAYKGEVTATIKATAIVGYVTVQDLTKMADIVRSRTFEAFFPLIAVAVIYFILAGILTAVVNRLGVLVDPRRRKREDMLKGVTVK